MKKLLTKKNLFFTLLLTLISFSILIYENRVVAQQPNEVPPGLEIAIDVLEEHTPSLMTNPEVTGTAVGLDDNGEPVIKVFVLTEQFRGIPQSLEGFPVEVEVTGMFVARSDIPAWETRPVPIGVSTGHPNITAGTIGCRVKDTSGNVYALSNNHIYADTNEALIGDSTLQPGPYDGGSDDPHYKIGELAAFKPIDFSGGDNTIDAAISLSSVGELGNATPSDDGYGTPSSTSVAASINQKVKKYGRTTGLTYGEVSGIDATINVCYQCNGPFCIKCKKLARFVDQIVISPGDFSAGGDSGSVIVTDDVNNDPVGLLFAGSVSVTIANPIDPVLTYFNVTVDDGAAGGCANNADCDDLDACNGTETCIDGSCQAGTPVNCDDGNACTTDSCDTGTGECSNPEIICDDGIDCTIDSCNMDTGECVSVDDGTCPNCSPVGGNCTGDADCCSNKCKGKRGGKTCKE